MLRSCSNRCVGDMITMADVSVRDGLSLTENMLWAFWRIKRSREGWIIIHTHADLFTQTVCYSFIYMTFSGISRRIAKMTCDTMSSQEIPVTSIFLAWQCQRASCSAAALHALSSGKRGSKEPWGPGQQFSGGHIGSNGCCPDRVWPALPQPGAWGYG